MAKFRGGCRLMISAAELAALERRAKEALTSVRKMPAGLARRDALKEANAVYARAVALCKYARSDERLITSHNSELSAPAARR